MNNEYHAASSLIGMYIIILATLKDHTLYVQANMHINVFLCTSQVQIPHISSYKLNSHVTYERGCNVLIGDTAPIYVAEHEDVSMGVRYIFTTSYPVCR